MLSYDNIVTLIFNIDRKSEKLDNNIIISLKNIKKHLKIEWNDNFLIKSKPKKLNEFKDGTLEKASCEIKIILNKISEKTYDKLKVQILEYIEKYSSDKFFENIVNLIFDVVSNNSIISKIYAKLYYELCLNNLEFKTFLLNKYNAYNNDYLNIEYAHPNEDYDKYLLYTKENDKKLNLSIFFVELYKIELLNYEQILQLLHISIDLFKQKLTSKTNTEMCEEIMKNIFKITKLLIEFFKNDTNRQQELYDDILLKINKQEILTYDGINKKIQFEIMNIEDLNKLIK